MMLTDKDMELIRGIVRDVVYEILDVDVWDVLFELVNAQEAGITAFKERLKRTKTEQWDPSKIKWVQAEGNKGPYERSEDINNLGFKEMLKDIQAHGGKMIRDGYFLWIFQNGTTVGRKRK